MGFYKESVIGVCNSPNEKCIVGCRPVEVATMCHNNESFVSAFEVCDVQTSWPFTSGYPGYVEGTGRACVTLQLNLD